MKNTIICYNLEGEEVMRRILMFFMIIFFASLYACVDETIKASYEPEQFVLKPFLCDSEKDYFEGRKRIWIRSITGSGEVRHVTKGKPGGLVKEWSSFFVEDYPPTFYQKGEVEVVWQLR